MSSDKIVLNYVKNDDIYILGGFDETISQNIIYLLPEIIDRKSKLRDSSINFYINSTGGNANELFGLIYFIEQAKKQNIKINTHILGDAYSCASYLSVLGDYRTMNKYSHQLLHYGTVYTVNQTPTQNARYSKLTNEHFDNLVDIYVKNTKISKKEIEKLMSDDYCFLNANDCLKYGLIDEII